MIHSVWYQVTGNGPLVAAALHNGHGVRADVADRLALAEADRYREEDPYTDFWTSVAETRFIGLRSRFEVDLNRPREKAVYRAPEDAWGLHVWKEHPSEELVAQSLAGYDAFYDAAYHAFSQLAERYGRFVVFDLHSYNHRRDGPEAPPADPEQNPEVNLGTGTMDRAYWAPLVERFMDDLRGFDYQGRPLDVRENVRFKGGYFPQWVHETFPETGCALAIEVKKFYMDECTGRPFPDQIEAVRDALAATVPGVLEALDGVSSR